MPQRRKFVQASSVLYCFDVSFSDSTNTFWHAVIQMRNRYSIPNSLYLLIIRCQMYKHVFFSLFYIRPYILYGVLLLGQYSYTSTLFSLKILVVAAAVWQEAESCIKTPFYTPHSPAFLAQGRYIGAGLLVQSLLIRKFNASRWDNHCSCMQRRYWVLPQ